MPRRKPIRKPLALKRGDAIAIVAPSSPVEPARLRQGIRELEAIGYRVIWDQQVLARQGFYAGEHGARTQALLKYLEDPSIRAVFCARGGYGSNYIVEQFSSRALLHRLQRLTPKIVMGYSDVTTLHLFLTQTLGWVSFQGPMLTKDFSAGETGYNRSVMEQLLGNFTRGLVLETDAQTWRPGVAEGRLAGGCFSLLNAALGTLSEIETKGTILLLEDVDEKPFRIDRMLFQLRRAGKLRDIKAVIFGEMPGCGLSASPADSLREIILDTFADRDIPIVFGLRFGHNTGHCLTLPLGVRARLEAGDQVKLTLLEPAVRPPNKNQRRSK
ncbi:MAG: LD-carboxypeptidase [Acidobacteria bacterium]|nr:LD-carboxypeptidase [Acidobacteriota bacterium]